MGIQYSTNGRILTGNRQETKGPFQRHGKPTLKSEIRTESVSVHKPRIKKGWESVSNVKLVDGQHSACPDHERRGGIWEVDEMKGLGVVLTYLNPRLR